MIKTLRKLRMEGNNTLILLNKKNIQQMFYSKI